MSDPKQDSIAERLADVDAEANTAWHRSGSTKERDTYRSALEAALRENARLREALQAMVDTFHPRPNWGTVLDNAWQDAQAALRGEEGE